MQTTVEPVVVPTIIEIPAIKEEERLQRMIQMVKEGGWCRDIMMSYDGRRHCVLGLINVVTRRDAQARPRPRKRVLRRGGKMKLVDLLFEAIPEEDKQRLSRISWGTPINGGTSRGWTDKAHAVATYNNTVSDEQEIIAWFERALVGIKS